MNLLKKTLVVFVGLLLSVPIIMVFWFFSTGGIFGDCEEDIVSKSISPDKAIEIIVFTKGCGATTALATHVKMSFRNGRGSETIFVAEYISALRVKWGDSQNVVVVYKIEDEGRIFKQGYKWQDIGIKYERNESSFE